MTAHVQRHRFDLRAAGHRLHAERLLPPHAAAGPTLVFLHEGLGSVNQWRHFPAELCAWTGLPGLAYDRWGHGRSEPLTGPRPDDYLEREARDSLPEVLAACGIADPPILFGHSDGGSIALLFAAAHPGRTRAAICEAAHAFIEEACLAGIRLARAAYDQGPLRDGLRRYHGANTETLFQGWSDTWLRPSRHSWNIEAELRRVACRALLIQGEDDEYGTRAQLDAIAAGVSGPAETLWLPGCAHIPHQQAREVVLAAAARFIERVCANMCP
jgi:pimeloyl-ACP methyl ester carboxylesterase